MPNEAKHYDLIIIGGGPAGLSAVAAATAQEKTVAMVDSHHAPGGTGFNSGTIPSKALRETALAMSGLKSRNLSGIEIAVRPDAAISDFLGRNQNVRAIFNHAFPTGPQSQLVEVFLGDATFVDAHTVSVDPIPERTGPSAVGEQFLLRAENILIATGSSPLQPALFPFASGPVYDSETIPQLQRVPRTMAVVGAGVIGSEYACTFTALGAKVHIIEIRDTLLPFLDGEVSQALTRAMESSGVIFHWNDSVQKCEQLSSGQVKLSLTSGDSLTVDAVLVATGRKGNTEKLNLGAAGVETGELGIIPVDFRFRTNVPHIFAVPCCLMASTPFRKSAWLGKQRSLSRNITSTTSSGARGMRTMRVASLSATRTAFLSCSSAGKTWNWSACTSWANRRLNSSTLA
jgi:NAD(P) transhydrogenase